MSEPAVAAERLQVTVVGTDAERRGDVAHLLDTDGMTVDTADATGDGALRGVDAAVVDLVSLDRGFATVRAVRAADEDVPVIALIDDARVTAAFDAGATDCVHVGDADDPYRRLPDRIRSVVAWRGAEGARARAAISETLKERAMDEAPIGITVSDPSLPDNPLVYVNESYVEMTGYEASEALGRNCRFLQGPGSDPETVAAMREAIAAEEPVSVELVNYRKDGSSFWNRVDVAPVRDASGTVTHFVGFQTDVTDRKRAEAEAKRYAVAAARQRAHLEHLVDRTEGLLQEITSALVGGESRQELEREVCSRLVTSGPYAAAWAGDVDLGADVIVPRVRVGDDRSGAVFDGLAVAWDGTSSDDPTARAATTRSVQVDAAAGGALHPGFELPEAYRAVAAVPLVHRDTLYGVLNLYATSTDAFDRERVVLSLVGRAVGAAISAVESRRVLLGTEVTELELAVEDETFAPLSVVGDAERRVVYEGAVGRDEDGIGVFVTLDPDDGAPLDHLPALPGVEAATRITAHEGVGLYELRCPPGSLVTRVADAGGRIRRLDAEEGIARPVVEVADRATARALFAGLREWYGDVELVRSRDRDRTPRTRQDFLADLEDRLTERQRTALQTAYLAGYFEWPHAVSGDELAEAMGVSRSTFHQHLRGAQRGLLAGVYGSD
jgi:PAS domain S-box-containing protein